MLNDYAIKFCYVSKKKACSKTKYFTTDKKKYILHLHYKNE